MGRRVWTVSLMLTLAVAAIPAFAATPAPQAGPATPASLLDAILAPAIDSPAPMPRIINPYYGYCSQTCRGCYSGDHPSCLPDPDTGFPQTCTRIPSC